MESIVTAFLFLVFGGGVLLVGLILAIVTGSARSDRLRRLEAEQARLREELDDAGKRVVRLESALGDAMTRLAYVHAEQVAMAERAAGAPALPQAPAIERVAPVAPREVADAPREAPPAPVPDVPAAVAEPVPVFAEPELPPVAVAARVEHIEPVAVPREPVPAPDPAPARAPTPLPPVARFDWERWIGVRGAAALGACVLVIAGLYFFKYSIENDLIPPALRVVLGVLVGMGAIGGSERMLRERYTVLANWVAGAGVAILYSAFWYAHAEHLIASSLAFGLMILVTAACGLLALRHDAMVVALLGLVGGFVTPVALSSGEDHPFGLFGYLLMLDAALLYLARKKGWPLLGALSLLVTAIYQVAWIGERMGPERLWLGAGILVVFGGVYAALSPAPSERDSGLWKVTRIATVLLPFAFGLYFGLRADLGDDLRPLGGMLCVVVAGAAWITRARSVPWASPVAAISATTVVGSWLLVHDRAAHAVEAAVLAVAIAAIFHAFVELDERFPRGAGRAPAARAAALSALGFLFCLGVAAAAPDSVDPRPWVVAWLVLAGLAVRQSLFPGYAGLRFGLGILLNVGFVAVHFIHASDPGFPAAQVFLVAVVAGTALAALSARRLARSVSPSDSDERSILLPFFTAAYFAGCAGVGPDLVPLALMLVALAAAAAWAARARHGSGWIVPAAALLGLGTLLLWSAEHAHAAAPWRTALAICAFASVFGAFVEVDRRTGRASGPQVEPWAVLAPIGGILVLAFAAASRSSVDPWPWLAGWSALGAVALRSLWLPGREGDQPLHLVLAVALGLAFTTTQATHDADAAFPGGSAWMLAGLATAVALLGAGVLAGMEAAKRWATHGAATLALILALATTASSRTPASPALFFALTLGLAAVAQVGAARTGEGGWSFAAVAVTAWVQTRWTLAHVGPADAEGSVARAALVGSGLAVALGAAWPLVAGRRLQASVWAWRAAAIAGPLGFVALATAWESAFGKGAIGLLPLALGAGTALVAWRARPLLPDDVERSALVWLLGVTVAAVSLAVPLQLRNEWVTVGWALEGAALLFLWRRLDHAGLKYTALAHLAVVAARLTVNGAVLDYHPRSSVPVFNWLAYTYWLPALALLGGWYLLRDLEVPRARAWEAGFYRSERPRWAVMAAAAAIVVFFVWVNLTIFDAFGTGTSVRVVFQRLPARDLTLSLAWAIYALVLLGVGMARRSAALRWTSLALIIVTIGKVFLYDLSHLHDLYRVVSLVGLALSLILISLLYQRFVFGKSGGEAR